MPSLSRWFREPNNDLYKQCLNDMFNKNLIGVTASGSKETLAIFRPSSRSACAILFPSSENSAGVSQDCVAICPGAKSFRVR